MPRRRTPVALLTVLILFLTMSNWTGLTAAQDSRVETGQTADESSTPADESG